MLQDDNVGKENDDLYIRSVCFSPDGKFIATGAEDKQIRVSFWDPMYYGHMCLCLCVCGN
jgi:glucose repression regulatory protein TUP1